MEQKLIEAIKSYLMSGSAAGENSCGRFTADNFDDYWDDLLPVATAKAMAAHCLECRSCLEGIAMAKQAHEEALSVAGQVDTDRLIKAARRTMDNLSNEENLKLKFAAAPDDVGTMGQALGAAIDIETGMGTIIECSACVGNKESSRGKFEIWGRQVEGVESGYQIEKPLDYLEEKLAKGAFRNCAELRAYNLDRRKISVDLRERIISHAGSLSLAIVMSIVNAIHERSERPSCLYSADIRQDGKLQKVGQIEAKIETAITSGIQYMVFASANINDVPAEYQNNPDLHVLFFDTLEQVLTHFQLLSRDEQEQAFCSPTSQADIAANCHAIDQISSDKINLPCISDGNMAPIFEKLRIDPSQHEQWNRLIAFLEDLSQTGDFRDALSTAFIIASPENIRQVLPVPLFDFSEPTQIYDLTRIIEDLADLVDGRQLAFVLNHNGAVDSIRPIDTETRDNNIAGSLLSSTGRRLADITAGTESHLFYLPPYQNQIQLFSQGALIARYCNGKWRMIDYDVLSTMLKDIALKDQISWPVLADAVQAAIALAEKGTGGTLALIPDTADNLNLWVDQLKAEFGLRLENQGLHELTPNLLESLARPKGAVVLDFHGNLMACHAYFRINQSQHSGSLSGTRHQAARQFSSQAQAMVLVASRYGTVTVYYSGMELACL